MPERARHLVPAAAAGQRLDQLLAALHPELSRSRLKALIEGGKVLVGGAAAKASRRLRGGEALEVELPAPAPAAPLPQEMPLAILYEDPEVVVLDKAPGVVV